jgi:hypothetical protein
MTKRPAVVLLLSLLMMAAITASTIVVSVMINNDYSQSRSLDQFTAATMAADAGIERGLLAIKLDRQATQSLDTTISDANVSTSTKVSSSADTSFTVTATKNTSTLPVSLLADQTYQFDISDISVKALQVTAVPGPVCNASTCGMLEISWVILDKSGNSEYQGRVYQKYVSYTDVGNCIDLNSVYNSSSNELGNANNVLVFHVKIRAIDGPVPNITAIPYAPPECQGSGQPKPLMRAITLTSTAGFNKSEVTAVKTVDVVWQPTGASLFNYVLFTEGNIWPTP